MLRLCDSGQLSTANLAAGVGEQVDPQHASSATASLHSVEGTTQLNSSKINPEFIYFHKVFWYQCGGDVKVL